MKKLVAVVCLGLVGCGGGGGDAATGPTAPTTPTAPPTPVVTAPPAATDTTAATPAPTSSAVAASPATSGPDWAVSGTWAEACSCNNPCPCLAGKKPSLGHCNETMLFHVDKGHYGATALDGLDVVIIGQSTHGKLMDQSIADKDMPLANTYLPKDASDDVAAAADAIFTRLSFAMAGAGKKHAVKRLGVKATFGADTVDVEIPGVLTAHMKAEKDAKGKAKVFDAFASTGVFGTGTLGVSLGLDFHDDGVAWKIKDRHAAWTPFAWDSSKGALPWEQPAAK